MSTFRPALLTDHYELTMISAALRDGTADRPCVFEVFSRRLPTGRRYGVVAGTARLIDLIRDFRFSADEVDFLRRTGVVDDTAAEWLAGYRFTGDVDGYAEGELFFPGSPILTVPGLRRVCGAGDAGAVGAQPRLRGGRGGRPDGHRGPGPDADRDGLPAGP